MYYVLSWLALSDQLVDGWMVNWRESCHHIEGPQRGKTAMMLTRSITGLPRRQAQPLRIRRSREALDPLARADGAGPQQRDARHAPPHRVAAVLRGPEARGPTESKGLPRVASTQVLRLLRARFEGQRRGRWKVPGWEQAELRGYHALAGVGWAQVRVPQGVGSD